MHRATSWIAELLRLERDGDSFIAREPATANAGGRLFGGLIAAQSLAAACATVDGAKLPQSLHAYFVRGGRPEVDVELEVERTRDGRSFDTRRVTATQDGTVILELLASFHVPEPGVDHHPPAPPLVSVDDAVALDLPAPMGDRVELRAPGPSPTMFAGPPHWIRLRGEVEDDPMVQACALTYLSDMGLLAASRPPGTPLIPGSMIAASLDHSIWFHRPFHADRWHCYQTTSLNNSDARGLAIGSFYDVDGALIATMAQEGLWRS